MSVKENNILKLRLLQAQKTPAIEIGSVERIHVLDVKSSVLVRSIIITLIIIIIIIIATLQQQIDCTRVIFIALSCSTIH